MKKYSGLLVLLLMALFFAFGCSQKFLSERDLTPEPVVIHVARLETMLPMQCIVVHAQLGVHMHFYMHDKTPVLALVYIVRGQPVVVLKYCYICETGELVSLNLDDQLYMNTRQKVYLVHDLSREGKIICDWLKGMLMEMKRGSTTPYVPPPPRSPTDRFKRGENIIFNV